MVLSKDKKIAICFGLIIGVLFNFYSLCFADEVENVDTIQVSGIAISNNSSEFLEDDSRAIRYILLEKGYQYTFSFGTTAHYVVVSQDIPDVGVPFSFVATTSGDYVYTAYDDTYIALSYNGFGAVPVTREPAQGMYGVIGNLAYTLSFSSLWEVVGFIVPILGIAILLALGFYLIKRIINKIKHKRGGV